MFELTTLFSSAALSFVLVALAEIGDKSQLVCMSLAAKHRAKPVLVAAIIAFGLLNLLAVAVGGSLQQVLPELWIRYAAAGLFALFGLQALLAKHQQEQAPKVHSKRRVFATTFSLIFLAELGDKTQIAVAALSSNENPLGVWLGASLALSLTSALGVYLGLKLFSRINVSLLHRLSGGLFLLLALVMLLGW